MRHRTYPVDDCDGPFAGDGLVVVDGGSFLRLVVTRVVGYALALERRRVGALKRFAPLVVHFRAKLDRVNPHV